MIFPPSNHVTLQLPAGLYAELQALASDEQKDPVELIAYLVAMVREHQIDLSAQPKPSTLAFQRILERATDLGVTDLAEQHDHYWLPRQCSGGVKVAPVGKWARQI
jgi:hypothetical protein